MPFADPTPTAKLPRASFGGIEFPVESSTLTGGLDVHLHKYRKQAGAQPEKNGRRLYTCKMKAFFDTQIKTYGGLWPEKLSQLRALFETQATRDLVIPQLSAKISMYCTNWSQELAWQIQSGERAEFEFQEDRQNDFLVPALLEDDIVSVDTSAANLALAAANFRAGDKRFSDLLDGIAAAVSALQAVRDQLALHQNLIASRVDGLVSLCRQASDTTATLANPVNWVPLDALMALWYAAVRLQQDLAVKRKPMRRYTTVGRIQTIADVSNSIYGDSTHTSELLQLNVLDDPFAIPVNTDVLYYDIAA